MRMTDADILKLVKEVRADLNEIGMLAGEEFLQSKLCCDKLIKVYEDD